MFESKLLKTATILSISAALLAIIVTCCGLLIPGFYAFLAETPNLLAGSLAQDASVLAVSLIMLAGIWYGRRNEARGVMLWGAGLAFLVYSYLIYCFDPVYTTVFPLYIAILSLTIFGLISLLSGLDVAAFRRQVDDKMPVRGVAVVLGSLVLLAPLWLAQIVAGIRAQSPSPFNPIFVIDLTMVIPASMLTAVLIWQRRDWGYVLAGILLAKFGLMGWYLLLSTLWATTLGIPFVPVELGIWAFLGLVGGGSFLIYLRHVHAPGTEPQAAGMAAN